MVRCGGDTHRGEHGSTWEDCEESSSVRSLCSDRQGRRPHPPQTGERARDTIREQYSAAEATIGAFLSGGATQAPWCGCRLVPSLNFCGGRGRPLGTFTSESRRGPEYNTNIGNSLLIVFYGHHLGFFKTFYMKKNSSQIFDLNTEHYNFIFYMKKQSKSFNG